MGVLTDFTQSSVKELVCMLNARIAVEMLHLLKLSTDKKKSLDKNINNNKID